MPKIQSYVPAKTYKRMEAIIEELHQDGALRHEANISSLTARLVDMGLILYELQNKKNDDNEESEPQDGTKSFEVEDFLRETLKGSLKTELYSQIVLQLLLYPEMVKAVGDYEFIKEQIQKTAEDITRKL